MIDLLKTDFKRVLKDKLFIVVCIIGGVFAVITPILYKLIFSLLNAMPLTPNGKLDRKGLKERAQSNQ